MKKILFPTDFSAASLNAFTYALELADSLGAEIITLHVYQLPVMDYDGVPPYLLETYNVFELGNFENFKGQVPVLRNLAIEKGLEHITISNILLEGDLVYNILNTAKTENIDLIVMSTKGASGLEEVFMGTVAAKILTSAEAVVLAVPETAVFSPIKKIGYALQFSEEDRVALRKVIDTAKAIGAAVECVHVDTPDDKAKEVVVADFELLFQNDTTFHVVEGNDVESAITDFAASNNIDVLAMLSHRRGFFESLFHHSRAKKMAYHTKMPLLAFH